MFYFTRWHTLFFRYFDLEYWVTFFNLNLCIVLYSKLIFVRAFCRSFLFVFVGSCINDKEYSSLSHWSQHHHYPQLTMNATYSFIQTNHLILLNHYHLTRLNHRNNNSDCFPYSLFLRVFQIFGNLHYFPYTVVGILEVNEHQEVNERWEVSMDCYNFRVILLLEFDLYSCLISFCVSF